MLRSLDFKGFFFCVYTIQMLLYVAFMKQRFCERLTNHSLQDGSYPQPCVWRDRFLWTTFPMISHLWISPGYSSFLKQKYFLKSACCTNQKSLPFDGWIVLGWSMESPSIIVFDFNRTAIHCNRRLFSEKSSDATASGYVNRNSSHLLFIYCIISEVERFVERCVINRLP